MHTVSSDPHAAALRKVPDETLASIDAHDTSLHDTLHDDASAHMPGILAPLKAERESIA